MSSIAGGWCPVFCGLMFFIVWRWINEKKLHIQIFKNEKFFLKPLYFCVKKFYNGHEVNEKLC